MASALCRPPQGGRHPTHLLDVLGTLPLDVIHANIWRRLSRNCHRAVRLTCRRGRGVVDPLTTVVACCGAAARRLPREEAAQRIAFLSRLPHLTGVEVYQWPDKDFLQAELRDFGEATRGRITQLTVHSGYLTSAGMRAACAAFPRLIEMEMETIDFDAGDEDEWREVAQHELLAPLSGGASDGEEEDEEAALRSGEVWLGEDVFQALQGSQLSKLLMRHSMCTPLPRSVLRGLGAVHSLQHVELNLLCLDAVDLQALRLPQLRHCELWTEAAPPEEVGVAALAPLFASSHLTVLVLLGGLHITGGAAGPTDAAALALLGGLRDLGRLDLGGNWIVDDATFAAVRRLSQLTALGLGHFQSLETSSAAPGEHLPRLQALWARTRCPHRLLQTLLPLLPLPSLTLYGCALELAVDHIGTATAAAALAAALASAAQHLAAAPRLQLPDTVTLTGTNATAGSHLTLTQLAGALRPLSGRVSHLHLTAMSVAQQPWYALQAALPGLRQLTLSDCELSSLGAAVVALPELRCLSLLDCTWTGRWQQLGWVALAALCWRPLLLQVHPAVRYQVVDDCRAVQEETYGAQQIVWMMRRRGAAR